MKLAWRALCGALLLAAGTAAQADLERFGPVNRPSPPGHGYPKWYQDKNGRVLDLCLPDAADLDGAQKTACLLETDPPYTFPSAFPDETFYFRAVSAPLDLGGDRRAVLVLALEAAFANDIVQAGDQMVFTRIRVTAGVPHDGTYRVTHPYGTETFHDVVSSGGNRDIVFTEDVGLTAGDFSQALTSRFGPFLQAVDADGAVKTTVLNGARFLSDGVSEERVTGSPYQTNFFKICGPLDGAALPERCVETELFTLTGRLHDSALDPIPSPLAIERASYSRDANGSRVDVVASATAGIGAQAPLLSVGARGMPPVKLSGPDALNHYYAQGIPVPAGSVPDEVTLINSGDTPPSETRRPLADEVSVLAARYDPAKQQLVVEATSSDKGGSLSEPPPALALEGFPGAVVERRVLAGDPASHRFTVDGLAVPPSGVSVGSAVGGRGRMPVDMAPNGAFGAGVPLAVNDFATATAGSTTPTLVDVLANDVVNPAAPIVLPISILPPAATTMGSLALTGDGKLSFVPGAASGTATFRYTVSNRVGTSNPGVLTVSVLPDAQTGPVPIANPDPGAGLPALTLALNASRVIDVLDNDSANDPAGTVGLDRGSVQVVGEPPSGSATVDRDPASPGYGSITYQAGAVPGPVAFTYTVRNTNGNVSAPAPVRVEVVSPEQLLVTSARCKAGRNEWDVRGTSSVTAGNRITLYLGATPGGPVLGTADVDALGEFRYLVRGGAGCTSPISLKSGLGTVVAPVAVQIRN